MMRVFTVSPYVQQSHNEWWHARLAAGVDEEGADRRKMEEEERGAVARAGTKMPGYQTAVVVHGGRVC